MTTTAQPTRTCRVFDDCAADHTGEQLHYEPDIDFTDMNDDTSTIAAFLTPDGVPGVYFGSRQFTPETAEHLARELAHCARKARAASEGWTR